MWPSRLEADFSVFAAYRGAAGDQALDLCLRSLPFGMSVWLGSAHSPEGGVPLCSFMSCTILNVDDGVQRRTLAQIRALGCQGYSSASAGGGLAEERCFQPVRGPAVLTGCEAAAGTIVISDRDRQTNACISSQPVLSVQPDTDSLTSRWEVVGFPLELN